MLRFNAKTQRKILQGCFAPCVFASFSFRIRVHPWLLPPFLVAAPPRWVYSCQFRVLKVSYFGTAGVSARARTLALGRYPLATRQGLGALVFIIGTENLLKSTLTASNTSGKDEKPVTFFVSPEISISISLGARSRFSIPFFVNLIL